MRKLFSQNSEAKWYTKQSLYGLSYQKVDSRAFKEANCSLNCFKNLHSKMIEANQWKLSVTAIDAGKNEGRQ